MKDVFKLVLTAVRLTKRYFKGGRETGSLWKSDAWDGLLQRLTSSEKYGQATGLHTMCKQVHDATRVSGSHKAVAKTSGEAAPRGGKLPKSKAKRKADEVEAPSEKPQKPKKRKVKVVMEVN